MAKITKHKHIDGHVFTKLRQAFLIAKQRRELANLNGRCLADIGVSSAQRDKELARGFFDF